MANKFSRGHNFSDGPPNDDVIAAYLHALIEEAAPTVAFVDDQPEKSLVNGDYVFIRDTPGNRLAKVKTDQFLGMSTRRLVLRNRILNGHPKVWQAGTSFANPTSYTSDGWIVNEITDGQITVSRDTTDPVPASAENPYLSEVYKILVTTADVTLAANQYFVLILPVEGQRAFPLFGWPTSIGIKVKSSISGTFCVTVRSQDATNSFIRECVIAPGDINNWKYFALENIPTMPTGSGNWGTDATASYVVLITLAAGTDAQGSAGSWLSGNKYATSNQTNWMGAVNNTFKIAFVQHESGQICTPLEYLDFADELQLCKRYYQKSYDYGISPGTPNHPGRLFVTGNGSTNLGFGKIVFSPILRALPVLGSSFRLYSTQNGTIDRCFNHNTGTDITISSVGLGDSGFSDINFAAAVASGHIVTGQWVADVRL
jgi:hypothetical protein